MQTNQIPVSTARTHEGAPAKRFSSEDALRRSVMSCLLFENEFYEDGVEIAKRIEDMAVEIGDAEKVAKIAIEAREQHNLRHVPLLLARILAKSYGGPIVGQTLEAVIHRADEITEFMAIYWKDGRIPIDYQVKKGLAAAFLKFDAYQLAKYDRAKSVRLRDVLRLVHPKPQTSAQSVAWKGLIDGTIKAPDTWEVALSSGADKKETFERLIQEDRLGYLALLRNLRNMVDVGVDIELIKDAILSRRGAGRVLPFRYVAAARAVPSLEPVLDTVLCEAIAESPILTGRTAILVDVSASMHDRLSVRSDLSRMDAAATLACMIHGEIRMFTFSGDVVEVPPRRGMAGVDVVLDSQPHRMTHLGLAVRKMNGLGDVDRLIVLTDEQSQDKVPDPLLANSYMINVGSYKNGVGYGKWTHIDGFSESTLKFIIENERSKAD